MNMDIMEDQPDYVKISSEIAELLNEFKTMDDFNRKRTSSKYNSHAKDLRKIYNDLNSNVTKLKNYITSVEKFYKNKKDIKNNKKTDKTMKGGENITKDDVKVVKFENNDKKVKKMEKMIKKITDSVPNMKIINDIEILDDFKDNLKLTIHELESCNYHKTGVYAKYYKDFTALHNNFDEYYAKSYKK